MKIELTNKDRKIIVRVLSAANNFMRRMGVKAIFIGEDEQDDISARNGIPASDIEELLHTLILKKYNQPKEEK